jgi:hypothetical protein
MKLYWKTHSTCIIKLTHKKTLTVAVVTLPITGRAEAHDLKPKNRATAAS